ncbi:hypothetical protein [Rheinheimera oceanensis]|uniref:hypothetical protein n=1 Tax=Rheinheimera oceanensis TaxID=2817449 RepID=UPI001BFE4581|nr:hypothetical protein [Rheinheimera oceanensis]
MNNIIKKSINHELKYDFHFIDIENHVPEEIWKDRNGEFINMEDMGLDHLNACIHIVKKAIGRLAESAKRKEVKEMIIPLAEKKLRELNFIFSKKKIQD